MTFADLTFFDHPLGIGGYQAIVFFGNGYGASVIFGPPAAAYEDGKYELAVIRKSDGSKVTPEIRHPLGFDFDFASEDETDIREAFWLDPCDIDALLAKISAMPSRGGIAA